MTAQHRSPRTDGEAAAAERSELPPTPIGYEDFLRWADEDVRAEWVDGEIIMMSPASAKHQDIAVFLVVVLRAFAEQHNLGVVLNAPFQMKLEAGREPDLIFLANAHLDRLQPTYLDGPADLAVEIVSPESAGRDRGDKFYEYARGGVAEYWLIDPQTEWAEFYTLEENHYRMSFGGRTGRYDSTVLPGLWLDVAWLWQEPLPKVLDVLRSVGLV